MFEKIYKNSIIEKPKFTLLILILILLTFGYFSKNFQLDASSDTLLLENDPDLKYLREVNTKYGSKDFLVLTYTPRESLLADNTIEILTNLRNDLKNLIWVSNVITILDVPLLKNNDDPLADRIKNFKTLSSDDVDKEKGFDEALLLNQEGTIAEGAGQNIFIVKNGTVFTNDERSSILLGITRDSLIKICNDLNL